MSEENTVAVAKDGHSIQILDVTSGALKTVIYVTPGQIAGQPLSSPNSITVTYTENGVNYMNVYNRKTLSLMKKQTLV